jgi:hypothetical protein
MLDFSLDLARPFFWIFLLTAILLLAPLAKPGWRRVLLALLNVGFATWIIGPRGALAVTLYCALIFTAARLAKPGEGVSRIVRILAISLVGGLVLLLFLLHTRPVLFPGARGILAAMGFSYLALRSSSTLRRAR